MCPISPPYPPSPPSSWPPVMTPPPMPMSPCRYTRSWQPAPAPRRCSASAPRLASLPTETGRPRPSRRVSPRRTPRPPSRCSARARTRPSASAHHPADGGGHADAVGAVPCRAHHLQRGAGEDLGHLVRRCRRRVARGSPCGRGRPRPGRCGRRPAGPRPRRRRGRTRASDSGRTTRDGRPALPVSRGSSSRTRPAAAQLGSPGPGWCCG